MGAWGDVEALLTVIGGKILVNSSLSPDDPRCLLWSIRPAGNRCSSVSVSPSLSLSLSLYLSLSHTHTNTHTHSLPLSLSHTHTHTLLLSLTLALFLSHTQTRPPCLSEDFIMPTNKISLGKKAPFLHSIARARNSVTAQGSADYSQVDMLGVRYKSVTIWAKKCQVSPKWRAQIH